MRKILALLALCASTALAADQSAKINGWVSDSMCGAKHAGKGGACVGKCIEGGAKPVFVDDEKKQVWAIENPDAVKGHYGHHITVTGTADASKKTVHVDGVAMLPDQGSSKSDGMHDMH